MSDTTPAPVQQPANAGEASASEPLCGSTLSSNAHTAPAANASDGGIGRKIASFLKRLTITIVVLALCALTFWLLSERNARLFKLSVDADGALVVLKGRTLPAGFQRWAPEDLETATTYAPFHLAPSVRSGLDLEKVYTEREQLDRTLFDLHREAAEQLAGREDDDSVRQVMTILQRAERLGGITDVQKSALKELMAKNAFFEGRMKLMESARLLQSSLSRLRLATESEDSRHAARSQALLDDVQRHATRLIDVAQRLKVEGPGKESASDGASPTAEAVAQPAAAPSPEPDAAATSAESPAESGQAVPVSAEEAPQESAGEPAKESMDEPAE